MAVDDFLDSLASAVSFFFSSRRRHTRYWRDWISDVCSSDLYWLDDKKVTKTAITQLLEVVLAAPNKLNIVQQGMITRISELNSEERRRIIEDIVGLSYFDEKKAEALKQLDEADRRLEVAFARMGEIRKRIDELETERNEHLRYEQLIAELKRFKAVQISNTIRNLRYKLATSTQVLESNNQKSSHLSKLMENAQLEIEKIGRAHF